MSTPNANTNANPNPSFDGIHVSKGFVRGLQRQVLILEQVQQSLIRQLDYANKMANECHTNGVAWKHKYDTALHEMEKMKQAFEHERKEWKASLNQVVDLYEREKKLRTTREQEMTHLEQLLAEQNEISPSRSPSPSPSPSPTHHPHRNNEEFLQAHPHHERMSPVSIPDEDDNDDDNDSALNEFYGNYYPNDAYSQTTDCSGDPICHSDSDSD